MGKDVMIDIDKEIVRFTPEGKVSAMDAIKALSGSENPWSLWERLKMDDNEILDHCEDYDFPTEDSVPVVDSEGLQKILVGLLQYISE